jgi:transposase
MKVKHHIPIELRYTMKDFNTEFPDDAACLEYVKEQRWPKGIALCAKCKVKRKHHRVGKRTAYACDYCGNHIYPLVGTIFQKSVTPLRTWFYAMYLMGSTRCGISAKQIQRETGVTYKTAWRMFRQIRSLLAERELLLTSEVEMDETYMGGVRKYGTGRPMAGDLKKTAVVAIVQRQGKVMAKTIPSVDGNNLLSLVRKHVTPGTTVYTDELKAYDGIQAMTLPNLQPAKYRHLTIKHSDRNSPNQYARGRAHTNSVEGYWSLLKRGINGVYHSVAPKYLQMYLDEYSFRYNHRFEGNKQFKSILERVSKRES